MEENLDKKTILIVDDETTIVDMLVYNLQKEGYNTLQANDGEEAVNIALNKKPDFSDCDIYTWCLETYDDKVGKSIYVDWKELSLPPDYNLPDYLAKTTDKNYNCGLLYFKNKDIFYYWKKEMLRFATNNPCIIFNKNYVYTSHIHYSSPTSNQKQSPQS